MNDNRIKYIADKMDVLSRRDRIFINNPVITTGLGLAPIVIPAVSMQNALIIAIAVIALLTPTRIIATFIGQHIKTKMRAIVYVLVSGGLYIALASVLFSYFPFAARQVGVYLPLLIMEPLIIKRYESGKSERIFTSIKKGVITTAGFCVVLLLVAAVREVLGRGTFLGAEVFSFAPFPLAGMPAGGFIIVGLICALWRGVVNDFKKRINMGVKELK